MGVLVGTSSLISTTIDYTAPLIQQKSNTASNTAAHTNQVRQILSTTASGTSLPPAATTSVNPAMSTTLTTTITDNKFMNTLIQELNTIKMNNVSNCSLDPIGDSNSISSINNFHSNCNKQNLWGKQLPITTNATNNNTSSSSSAAANLWGCPPPPQSPSSSSSIHTQYHSASSHSNSKESLWTSNQSSPNSNLRDSFYSANSSNNSLSSSTHVTTNLWENPILKVSQAALMNSSRESNGSIFSFHEQVSPPPLPPPQQQQQQHHYQQPILSQPQQGHQQQKNCYNGNSNNASKISNLWDISTPYVNNIPKTNDFIGRNQQTQLIRPHDILNDLWSNSSATNCNGMNGCGGSATVSCAPNNTKEVTSPQRPKDSVGSLWRTPNPINSNNLNLTNNCVINNASINKIAAKLRAPHPNATSVASIPPPPPPQGSAPYFAQQQNPNSNGASSSCLQLFSEDFLNYLNMIN